MTNRERLRNLNNEELAEELWNYFYKIFQLKTYKRTDLELIEKWLEVETGDLHDPVAFRTAWTVRTMNCLYRANIRTFDTLIKKTPDELMNIRNFGKGCLQEVLDKLDEKGLNLKE